MNIISKYYTPCFWPLEDDMLYTVTIRDLSTGLIRDTKIWASSARDAINRAVGRCKRYQVPVHAVLIP